MRRGAGGADGSASWTGPGRALLGGAGARQQVHPVATEERDPPVVAAQRAAADPHHLAGRAELVEQARRVAGHACRQDVALEDRRRDRHALELRDGLDQPASPPGPSPTPCQDGRKRARTSASTGSTSRRRRGQRAAPELAEDVGIGELVGRRRPGGRRPPGAGPAAASARRRSSTVSRAIPQRDGGRLGDERGVAPRPAHEQRVERPLDRLQPGLGHAGRRAGADGVAEAGDVLDRDPSLLAADPSPHRAARRLELAERVGRVEPLGAPRRDLVGPQVAQPAQQVGSRHPPFARAGPGQRLELELEVGHGLRVDQLAQLLAAEQLGKQLAVERQRLGSPLGERRVALVHERADVVEQQ